MRTPGGVEIGAAARLLSCTAPDRTGRAPTITNRIDEHARVRPARNGGADSACPHDAVVVGRAIHAPWNEGTRVIARNTARAAALAGRVAVVSVTNPRFAEPDVDPTIPIDHVETDQPYGVRSDYAPLARVIRLLEAVRPRRRGWVAHLIGAPLVLAPWVRLRGGRVVAHVTLTSQAYQGRVDGARANLGWRLFGRWIDAWAASSVPVRDALVQRGQEPETIHVVPPATDTDRFAPVPRADARAALGWAEDEPVVVYVGTISPLRFPATDVVAGLRLAARSVPRLRLAAFAPLATHEYNVTWAESNLGAEARGDASVTLELGDLTEEQKALVYSAADALLLPFRAQVAVEPPLTLLEGMACGAVPFVTPAANRSGIVHEGANGYGWTTPEDLAAALVAHLTADAGQRRAMAEEARTTVLEGYSMDAVARRIHDLWHEIGRAPGLSVAVVGPDGAGKSTLVHELADRLGPDAVSVYLGVDRVAATHSLPTTRWLVRRRARIAAARMAGTHRRSRVPGLPGVRLGARAFDRLAAAARPCVSLPHELAEFGYRMLVGAVARRRGRVVLFDRFVYDSLIDCEVDRLGSWQRFRARLLARLGRPDLMLVLDAPGEVLFARKGEHDPRRLERVRREIRRVAGRAPESVVLDATLPEAQVADLAEAAVRQARQRRGRRG